MSEETPARGGPVAPSREDLCLVTGASGFIGGCLAERLVSDGYRVRCLVRASSDRARLDELDVQITVGDLMSTPSLARAVAGCRYVLHCGALVSDWATKEEIVGTNVEGTRSLLEASVSGSVKRFVHISTTDVYGYPEEGYEIDEAYTAMRFRNWYAQTKREAEAEVWRLAGTDRLEAVILRPATVYGPGSKEIVGKIARAIEGRHMLLVDGGRAIAGLCYVESLIDAVLLALRHDAAPGHAFNIGDGLDITWRQFTDDLAGGLGYPKVRWSLPYWMANGIGFSLEHGYRLLRKATGLTLAPLLSRQAVQVLGKNQDFSNRKARETLGWTPHVDYSAGLEATLAWLRTEYLEPA